MRRSFCIRPFKDSIDASNRMADRIHPFAPKQRLLLHQNLYPNDNAFIYMFAKGESRTFLAKHVARPARIYMVQAPQNMVGTPRKVSRRLEKESAMSSRLITLLLSAQPLGGFFFMDGTPLTRL